MQEKASHGKMSEWWVIRQREKLLQKLTHGRVCLVKAVVLKQHVSESPFKIKTKVAWPHP